MRVDKFFTPDVELETIIIRPVALVDIDHTLVFSRKGGVLEINYQLLDALAAKGIKDLFLFTDMTMSLASVNDRIEIITKLKERGFSVHGCITPLDYFWGTDSDTVKALDIAFYEEKIIMRLGSPKNLDQLSRVLLKFPAINDRINSEIYPEFGQAYREAEAAVLIADEEERRKVMVGFLERSNGCKAAIDAISYLKKFDSSKAIMLLQFIAHLPNWVSSISIFDDMLRNIDAVKQVIALSRCPVSIEAFHGDFNESGDTFTEKFAPELIIKPVPIAVVAQNNPDAELVDRMKSVAARVQKHLKDLQKNETFGTLRFKKEYTFSEEFFKRILASGDDFLRQWECVKTHFKTLKKRFGGDYIISEFEKKLIELLCSDPVICTRMSKIISESSKRALILEELSADPQNFLRVLLADENNKEPKVVQNTLFVTTGSLFQLSTSRDSERTSIIKKKLVSQEPGLRGGFMGRRRERSQSAGSARDMDILSSQPAGPRVPNSSANESQESSGNASNESSKEPSRRPSDGQSETFGLK